MGSGFTWDWFGFTCLVLCSFYLTASVVGAMSLWSAGPIKKFPVVLWASLLGCAILWYIVYQNFPG